MREVRSSQYGDIVTVFGGYEYGEFPMTLMMIEAVLRKTHTVNYWILPATDAEYSAFCDSGEMRENGLCEQANSY